MQITWKCLKNLVRLLNSQRAGQKVLKSLNKSSLQIYPLVSRLKHLFLTRATVDFQNRYLPTSLLKTSFQKSRYLLSARNQWIVFAQWIVDLYNHMSKEKNTIINGFKSAGVTEAIQSSQDIVMQNPFSE